MLFSILTNAQSPGIVNRLMRYYEESQGDSDKNRYVYNKVGDFPIVQLKKNEIKRNFVRSPSVRIAPPSKSIMNRDIRAAILRSNSFQLGSNVPKLLPVKMRAKDDSHQIILNHEPLPINEHPQSAKSVLDALEKNCRKRINNEELTLDRNKRICAQTQEVVDASRDFIPIAQQSGKRGRDQISPGKNSEDSQNSQLRKRSRIRNNALLSSLSSSTFLLKPFNSKPSFSPPKPVATSSVTSIQTKALDEIELANELPFKPVEEEIQSEKAPPKLDPPTKRLHLFNIDPSTFHPKSVIDDDDEVKINFVKPRQTKSNLGVDIVRHIQQDKLAMMLSGLSDGFKSPTKEVTFAQDVVDLVPASISFTTSTTTSAVAPIISPIQSNPLLPLNVDSTSTNSLLVPASKPIETAIAMPSPIISTSKATEIVKPLPTFQFGITTTAPSTNTSTALPSLVVAPVSTTPAVLHKVPAGTGILFNTTTQSNSTSTPDQSKPLISFTPISKDSNISSPLSVASTSSSLITNSVSASLTTMSNPGFGFGDKKEVASGFSFGNNGSSLGFNKSSAETVVPANVIVTSTTTTSPSSFIFSTPTTTAFSFGTNPVPMTAAASGINTGISSSLAGALTNTVSFIEKPATTTASGIGFSFNNNTSANPVVPTTSPSSGFSFGSSQNKVSANSIPAPTATPNSFSFGASSNNSVFGQPQQQTQPQSGFPSFGQKTEAPSSGMFSFTQKTTDPVTVTTTSTFSFGGSTHAAPTQESGFSFGQSNAVQPTLANHSTTSGSIFSRLSDKSTEVKPAFSFGGSNQTQPTKVVSPFGNITNNNSSNNNSQGTLPLFGSSGVSAFNQTTTPNNSIFGGSQPMTQSNDFGGNTKPSIEGLFAFGTSNNQQQAQPALNATFDFGKAAGQNNSQISNAFGGPNVTASFTYKPSTGAIVNNNSAPNIFGQNQSSTTSGPPAYHQFGSPISNNVSTSFTFGGASNNSVQQTAPQPTGFNFNAPQSAPVSGAFNFQAAQPSLTPQPSSGGLFNIGTGGNQRRPMRQGTRRIK